MSEKMPIVEWLRLHDCWGGGRVDEAADRIEELEARYHREQDRIERLIEENARLRGALRDIAEHNVGGKLEFDTPLGMWVGEPAAYAAEAIGEGEIYYRRKVLRND